MALYKLTDTTSVIRTTDGRHVPNDDHDYQDWLLAGNTPDPAAARPPIYDADGRIRGRVLTVGIDAGQLYRVALPLNTGYLAALKVVGIDLGNGAMYAIAGDVTIKRLGAGASIVGMNVPTAMRNIPQTDGWSVTASASGNDFVITVVGATGRQVDWTLNGTYISFTPTGR
jgi:hypothetical protein